MLLFRHTVGNFQDGIPSTNQLIDAHFLFICAVIPDSPQPMQTKEPSPSPSPPTPPQKEFESVSHSHVGV